jgi:hypothetical protein
MKLHPPARGELIVDSISYQRVGEAELPDGSGDLGDDSCGLRFVENGQKLIGIEIDHVPEAVQSELPPED